jgi:ketosteroid isomerase-like protein
MADSPNVAVVRRAFDAFTLRDVERLVATCSPDVEFDLPTARLARTGQPYHGHEGVRTYMRDAARVWTELRLEAREFHEIGDLVVAVGRVYAWGEGRVVDPPSAWVWKLRDGLVLRVTVYESRSEAFVAAGLAAD